MNRVKQLVLLVMAIVVGLSSIGFSQTSTTSLRGTVTDPSGSVVSGATVVLTNAESKIERTATAGVQGGYQFLAVSPGTYTLSVTAQGFRKYEQTGLELLVNTPATANVQLKVGAVAEVVTVNSEAPALNLVDASIGNPFNESQVKQIPLEGRNVPELLSLQAGVTYTGNRFDIDKDQDTRNGAVNGARSDQSNITLDGVDVNDQSNGYAFTSVLPTTLDSVQEFRVTTSNYNADQGEGSGAQVALITKSGTNNFHGSLYEYHRNTITSANDYFIKTAEIANGQPNKPDKLIRNIFGASMGGPIQKNRLFFFVNYEGTRQREEQSTLRTIPSPAMRDGVIQYQCPLLANGQLDAVTCPGGTVQGNSLTSYRFQPGFFGLSPGQIKALDPLGLGPNPVMLNYFQKTYGGLSGNDSSVGDGFNYVGFRFRAPVSLDNNAFIARLDYHLTADGKHTLFWRGALQNLNNPQAPFLPGKLPEQILVDHSKGFVVGYTSVLSSSKVNTLHWGFTRQSTGIGGNANQDWNTFDGLDQGIFYSHNARTPTHNLLDDFSWTKGAHTLQFGTNVGFARNPRVSYQHSFSQGRGATNWMAPTGFAYTKTPVSSGSQLDPAYGNYPEPASATAYDLPMLSLLGMVSDIRANYNYDKSGSVLNYMIDNNRNPISATGAPTRRDYGLNWYEFYGQDSWRVKPNLTVTYGLRWSLFPPPWEVNGFQASPTCVLAVNPTTGCPSWAFNLGTEFNQLARNMSQGLGYDSVPLASFVLGGPGNPGPGFYHFAKADLSPRVSFAYSPRPESGWLKKIFGEGDKTVIRGGFSRVYDRAGMQLLSTFDANPPGGLGITIQNPCCYLIVPTTPSNLANPSCATPCPDPYDTADGVPRVSANINTIPQLNQNGDRFFLSAPAGSFPQTPLNGLQAIDWGIDQSLKTPYSYAIDFSVGRELPKRFSLQLSYVGRMGRHLLTQRDLRQPLDLVDNKNGPGRGIDYFSAATRLSQLARQGVLPNQITDQMVGKTAAYWHDMFGPLLQGASSYEVYFNTNFPQFGGNCVAANGSTCPDPNLIQAVYGLYTGTGAYPGNEVVGLGNIDLYYYLFDDQFNTYFFANPKGTPQAGDLLNNQLTTMYAWSSIGNSAYNGLQASLRKQLSHGVQFDLNYTYSRSIDITSSATRLGFSSSVNVGAPGSRLVNAFDPNGRRGVSDFDTTHQINANWIAELPFGKGRYFAGNAGSLANAVVSGWQLSGVARWTSGFPFTVDNGNFWPTDWDEQGIAQMIAKPRTGHFRQPDGSVSAFANPAAAFADFQHPFPGQSGSRNVVRGDGYAGLDMALSKRWKTFESQNLQFRWEVFNVPNLHRFNAVSGLGTAYCACIAGLQQVPSAFGDYTGLLTQPRVMQFALRYEF